MEGTISIFRCFEMLDDPRTSNRDKPHKFFDILAIALCATIAGSKKWPEVVEFGKQRQEWLSGFLSLEHGIPSRSTFERVFAALSPYALQHALLWWVDMCSKGLDIGHISIDGKTLRGSKNSAKELGALHIVSAWANEAQLSLGQVAVEEKSNEITAIPQLLKMLQLKGAMVTIDAMGCQKAIAEQIVDAGGDYVLMVKGNQPSLQEEIIESFVAAEDVSYEGYQWDEYQSEEQGHGRHEKRLITLLYDEEIASGKSWKSLHVLGRCISERTIGGVTSTETRWFIGSRIAKAELYAETVRGHWGIENKLHWHLDVSFGEDASHIQNRNRAENMNILRKAALALLKQNDAKGSINTKQFKAALNPDYLQEVLQGAKK